MQNLSWVKSICDFYLLKSRGNPQILEKLKTAIQNQIGKINEHIMRTASKYCICENGLHLRDVIFLTKATYENGTRRHGKYAIKRLDQCNRAGKLCSISLN